MGFGLDIARRCGEELLGRNVLDHLPVFETNEKHSVFISSNQIHEPPTERLVLDGLRIHLVQSLHRIERAELLEQRNDFSLVAQPPDQ
jgi:hypothetical protein